MNEPTQEELTTSDISRRKMLQRSAFVVGAAAVWSTPIVQSLGQRPATANSDTVSPYWVEFSVLAAEVEISNDPIESRNGTWIVKYSGTDDGTEGEWEIGSIPCPEFGGPGPNAEESTILGDQIGLVVESTTDPTQTTVEVCYTGGGDIEWIRTAIKVGAECDEATSTNECAVFETQP